MAKKPYIERGGGQVLRIAIEDGKSVDFRISQLAEKGITQEGAGEHKIKLVVDRSRKGVVDLYLIGDLDKAIDLITEGSKEHGGFIHPLYKGTLKDNLEKGRKNAR